MASTLLSSIYDDIKPFKYLGIRTVRCKCIYSL